MFFIDSYGLTAEVIIYSGEGNAWYGHAEIAINDTIYSYGNYIENDMRGPGILVKTSKEDYLEELNSTRQFTVIPLDLTEKEEDGITNFYESLITDGKLYDNRSEESGYMKELYYLSGKYKTYNAVWRNCSTTVVDALQSSVSHKKLSYTEKPVESVPATWYSQSILPTIDILPSNLKNSLSSSINKSDSIVKECKTYKVNTYQNTSVVSNIVKRVLNIIKGNEE